MTTHPVCSFLRSRLKEFLIRRNESVRWLSRQAGLDYAKLYRLESGEAKSFCFFEARKLLRFIDPNGWRPVLEEFYPEESRVLREDVAFSVSEQQLEKLSYLLSSEHVYEFYLYLTENTLTSNDIARTYGTKGLELEQLLVDKGIVEKHESGYRGILSGVLDMPSDILKGFCQKNIELIDIGLPGSLGGHYGRAINLEGKKALYKLFSNAWREAIAIMEDPAFRGDDVFLVSLMLGGIKSMGVCSEK